MIDTEECNAEARDFWTDEYDEIKRNWILELGSEPLKIALSQGYKCEQGYLAERMAIEYPGFTIDRMGESIVVDTPSQWMLEEAIKHEGAMCVLNKHGNFLMLKHYLYQYTIVKQIYEPTISKSFLETITCFAFKFSKLMLVLFFTFFILLISFNSAKIIFAVLQDYLYYFTYHSR